MILNKKRINLSVIAISVALSLAACNSESTKQIDPVAEENTTAVAAEIINGSFEDDVAGETSPAGNWVFRDSQGGGAVSTIEVIESEEGVNSYKGTKAVKVLVDTLGGSNWDVEVAYEDIPVIGGKTYEFSVWAKGAVGTNVDFYIQTPEYAARNLTTVNLTGEWQEIKLTAKADVNDTLHRLAVHFSKAGNVGEPIYLDAFSGVISNVPDVVIPEVIYSAVDVESLKALKPELNIGVAVPAGSAGNSIMTSEDRQMVINTHFNQLSAENIMKPESLHPQQDMPFFDDADELVDYAKTNAMTVHGHVLVWHGQIPGWMQNFKGERADWITMMEAHIKLIAEHFDDNDDNTADTVVSWDVVNEAFNENGTYRGSKGATNPDPNDNSVWYENIGEEFIPLAFKAARDADGDADLYYNDYNLIWNDVKLDAVIAMVNTFEPGTISGIGFQTHISVGDPTIETIRANLEKVVSQTTLKIKITELDVRMNNVPDSDTPLTYLTSERADEQKQYYHDIVEAYLDIVPAERRGGITVWGAIDGDSWLQSWPAPTTEWPLLFNSDYTAKPALQGYADALEEAE